MLIDVCVSVKCRRCACVCVSKDLRVFLHASKHVCEDSVFMTVDIIKVQ